MCLWIKFKRAEDKNALKSLKNICSHYKKLYNYDNSPGTKLLLENIFHVYLFWNLLEMLSNIGEKYFTSQSILQFYSILSFCEMHYTRKQQHDLKNASV